MEDLTEQGFDLGFLPPEEAAEILGAGTPTEEPQENEEPNNITEEDPPSEKVGNKEEPLKNTEPKGKGSPNNISSIARAFRDYGVLQGVSDEDINGTVDAETFAELLEKEITSRLDERNKFLNEAYEAGIPRNTVDSYRNTMNTLNNITDDSIEDEENGEQLRRNIIMQNYLNKGMSEDKANKWTEKSFANGDDIEDAKDALQEIKEYYTELYNAEVSKGRKAAQEAQENQKKQAEQLKKSILEDKNVFGNLEIDVKTRKKIYESISTARHKVGNSYLSDVQKYQQDNPTEFLKYVGLFYTMTDGFKNIDTLISKPVKKANQKNVEALTRVLNNTSMTNRGGSMTFATGISGESDPFNLGDNWEIDNSN